MVLGQTFYGDIDSYLDEKNPIGSITSIEFKESVLDEVLATNDVSSADSVAKKTWNNYTIFLAQFKDNLQAGNINFDDQAITSIRFKRRVYGELTWQNLVSFTYSGLDDFFEYVDRYVQSTEIYEYAIVPYAGILEGDYIISEPFEVDYEGCYLMDITSSYRLLYNLQIGDFETIRPNEIVDPVNGSKYPIVLYNGDLQYQKGSMTALITLGETGVVDRRVERIYRKGLMDFLCDGNPKLLKNSDGMYMIVGIVGNPTLSPFNFVSGIYTLNLEVVEIGDPKIDAELVSAGLAVEIE